MATKTISVDLEAYERLRKAKASERESFSQVIKRAVWPPNFGTAARMLEVTRSFSESKSGISEDELDRLDRAQEDDAAPPDLWTEIPTSM